ncbi:hypothetical protein P170DRAFT_480097 [Aspergillus steynii IBT 23096]|uniref:Uncharacterized protein n=1 Tax=Aspergillus steynii IBT 23096 TaxID=1392250 RepID=A0A2I2FUL6_9EURO|nr:uncharacterized protein P170DRAFT_480097 [Aspergillus steynii IBT 23096]PLB44333.1 hypothetical protein P170DRAFT_480097 [Aspergillus steynii IBT 23096]
MADRDYNNSTMPTIPTSKIESVFRNMTQGQQGSQQQQGGTSLNPEWNTEEILETTLDKNGNPVPDRYAYTDGVKMSSKGPHQQPEADAYEAATEDFD